MARVACFHNECAPYIIPVFEGIAKLPQVELKIYFGRYRSSIRKWDVKLSTAFDYEILREAQFLPDLFSFDPIDDPNTLNPSLFFKLVGGRYDAFMGGSPNFFGTIITFFVAKLQRKPFILFAEDIDIKGDVSGRLGRIKKDFRSLFKLPFISIRFFMTELVTKNCNSYVVPGTAAKEYLVRRGVKPYKIFTAVNALDNNQIEKECDESIKKGRVEKLKATIDPENKKIILAVSYLLERKGLQHLIQACGELKKKKYDFTLVIVGKGQYRQNLETLSVQNDLETKFTGYVQDVYSYYLSSDVFVFPTLRDVWGFVINEAMVCGCPIITTTGAGASKDMVHDGLNGFVVEAGNVNQIAHAIETVLGNDDLRKKMSAESKNMIHEFSFENCVKGYKVAIDYALKRDC
jgi:glycosyltransferase involved in cell wall biosynthesis